MEVTIEQVRKALEPTILATPGVVGLGHVGDRIRIYVEGSPEFPENIAGYGVDVVKVGHIRALPLLAQQEFVSLATSRTSRMRPALGGCSVGHFAITAGSLGMALEMGSRLYALTNNHVGANSSTIQHPAATIGDPWLQPGNYDGGTVENDTLTNLAGFVPLDEVGDNEADTSIGGPLSPADLSSEILEVGEPTRFGQAYVGQRVRKSGRNGLTTGIVQDIDATITVDYGGFEATFVHQIMTSYMADGGDSGSALLDEEELTVVGLLYSGSEYVTCHNHINSVLEALAIGPRALGTFPWRTLSLAPLGALALYLLR